jgi:predicted neuraminidase
VDALRLRDGRILLVYNHSEDDRDNLQLAISADQGRTWRPGAILEEGANQEYSYPNLAEDQDGRIHLTYTWQRERIKHVTFNLAWLDHRALAQATAGP